MLAYVSLPMPPDSCNYSLAGSKENRQLPTRSGVKLRGCAVKEWEASGFPPPIRLAVRPRYEQDRQPIKHEHEREIQFRARSRARELFPSEQYPQCRHHRSRLADRVRNRK